MENSLNHILVITTSFPDPTLEKGQEAAGSFVWDFVFELSKKIKVSVIAPSLNDKTVEFNAVTVHYFKVPRLPLSLLNPLNPLLWISIYKTILSGQKKVNKVSERSDIAHLFALWALPSGFWAMRAQKRSQIPYSIWALGSDIWGLKNVPSLTTYLLQ